MKSIVKTVVTLAALGAALYFTNPTMDDFGAHYERKMVASSQKNAPEALKTFAKALAETGADIVIKLGYKRDDKLLFSFYTLGKASNPSERYIGFLKFVFIELK